MCTHASVIVGLDYSGYIIFKGENIHILLLFHCFVPISENFLHKRMKARNTVGITSEQFTKSHFSNNLRKFSPPKDSHYTVV